MLPFATIAQLGLGGLMLACLATWWQLLRQQKQHQSPIPMEPRPAVPWGLCHLLAALFLLFLLETGAASLARHGTENSNRTVRNDPAAAGEPQTQQEVLPPALTPLDLWATAGARLAMLAAAVLLIVVTVRPSIADLGVRRGALLTDFRLGCRVFLMFGPPAYAIQMLLTVWVPQSHPIIESLRAAPDTHLMIASVTSAVIAAPLQEEFLWRLLFQGWLEKLDQPASEPTELLIGRSRKADSAAPDQAVALWPILVSSALFALLHLNHGPAAAALLFFATGLGWVYHRTHRILPCVTAHLLLNACSLTLLFLELEFGSKL